MRCVACWIMSSWLEFSSKVKAVSSTAASSAANEHGKGNAKEEAEIAQRYDGEDAEKQRSQSSLSGPSSVEADAESSSTNRRGQRYTSSKGVTSKSKRWTGLLGKPDKKLPAYLRPSPDVTARSYKHDGKQRTTSLWTSTPSSQLDDVRSALERKARMYDQLQRGKTAGVSEEQLQACLIDWDRKEAEQHGAEDLEDGVHSLKEERSVSGQQRCANRDEDDSLIEYEDDPLVEYEDEFGRTRHARRSELPSDIQQAKAHEDEKLYEEAMVIRGPANSFPVYRPDPTRQAQLRMEGSSIGAYKRQAPDHFEAQSEKRYRGAGFYQFSQDEGTRRRQMEFLRKERSITQRERAVSDSEPQGEVEQVPKN